MPRYDYQCRECGYIFEEDFSIEKRLQFVQCGNCGGVAERIISSVTFMLKGDCWARDGYTYSRDKAEAINKLAEEG